MTLQLSREASVLPLRVGMFTEVYHPIVNGVVASIDALRAGLVREGVDVVTFAPRSRERIVDETAVVRFPSLPLPTATGYRFCLPYLEERDRERVRTLDIVHAHSPFVSGWFAASHARRTRVPLIFTYHTRIDEYAHYAPFERHATRALMLALTRAFANRADRVIAPTHAMERRLREIGVTAPIDVVPSAIEVTRFAQGRRSEAVRALLGASHGERIALVVARLAREKNIELAIDAMHHMAPGIRLAIVGEGPHRDALVARIERRGLAGRVHLAGALPPAVMPDIYASSDAFVFTSATDTQGLVLAEALAAGLPIATLDSPVAREGAGAPAHYAPGDAPSFGRAIQAAAGQARSTSAIAAGSVSTPERQARAMRSIYHAAQSAVHLAP